MDPDNYPSTLPSRMSQGSPPLRPMHQEISQDPSHGYGFDKGYMMQSYTENHNEIQERKPKISLKPDSNNPSHTEFFQAANN